MRTPWTEKFADFAAYLAEDIQKACNDEGVEPSPDIVKHSLETAKEILIDIVSSIFLWRTLEKTAIAKGQTPEQVLEEFAVDNPEAAEIIRNTFKDVLEPSSFIEKPDSDILNE